MGALARLLEILSAMASTRLELALIHATSTLGTVLLRVEPWVGLLLLDCRELVRTTAVGSTVRGLVLLPMDVNGLTHLIKLNVRDGDLLIERLIDVLHGRGQLQQDDHCTHELRDVNHLSLELIKA